MIGLFAPGAKDVPEIPGFVSSASVMVAPLIGAISLSLIVVTATNE
jgi:hypothetical protein